MIRNDIPNILFEKIHKVEPFPTSVAPVVRMINKTAFFPGGRGLWQENETDVFPSILVLGQDFSTLDEYLMMLEADTSDLSCSTWRNIIKLFNEAEIDLCDCFFSNVFMGLRKTKSMVGKFPGFKDVGFVQRNLEYLQFQLQVIKPKLIITLGIYAAKMLGYLSPENLMTWESAKAFNQMGEVIKNGVKIGDHSCTCVALIHPSMRHFNLKRIQYKDFVGNEAEVNLLRDAIRTLL